MHESLPFFSVQFHPEAMAGPEVDPGLNPYPLEPPLNHNPSTLNHTP